jgi:hypothetical protein
MSAPVGAASAVGSANTSFTGSRTPHHPPHSASLSLLSLQAPISQQTGLSALNLSALPYSYGPKTTENLIDALFNPVFVVGEEERREVEGLVREEREREKRREEKELKSKREGVAAGRNTSGFGIGRTITSSSKSNPLGAKKLDRHHSHSRAHQAHSQPHGASKSMPPPPPPQVSMEQNPFVYVVSDEEAAHYAGLLPHGGGGAYPYPYPHPYPTEEEMASAVASGLVAYAPGLEHSASTSSEEAGGAHSSDHGHANGNAAAATDVYQDQTVRVKSSPPKSKRERSRSPGRFWIFGGRHRDREKKDRSANTITTTKGREASEQSNTSTIHASSVNSHSNSSEGHSNSNGTTGSSLDDAKSINSTSSSSAASGSTHRSNGSVSTGSGGSGGDGQLIMHMGAAADTDGGGPGALTASPTRAEYSEFGELGTSGSGHTRTGSQASSIDYGTGLQAKKPTRNNTKSSIASYGSNASSGSANGKKVGKLGRDPGLVVGIVL